MTHIENKQKKKENTKSQNVSSKEILQVKLNHDLCQKEFVQLKKETMFQLKQMQFNLTQLQEKIMTRMNENNHIESFKNQDETYNKLTLQDSWKRAIRAITACRHSIEQMNSTSLQRYHCINVSDYALRHPMLNRPTKPPPRNNIHPMRSVWHRKMYRYGSNRKKKWSRQNNYKNHNSRQDI